MNKKGSVLFDMIYIALMVFFIGMCFVVGWLFFSKVNDQFQASPDISTEGKAIMSNTNTRMTTWLDGVFLTVFIGLYIGSLILAFQIDSHPIFFPISIIIFIILIIVSAVLGNTFYQFAADSQITPYAEGFTIIPFAMNHFVQIILVMGFGLSWVMWGKLR